MISRRILLIILVLGVFVPFHLTAQSNEDCEACHSDPELATEHRGRTISLYVNFKRFARSVHGDAECIDCHQDADVEDFPHPETLEKVNCGICHDAANEKFHAGTHGRALKRGAPYAPTCSECHADHYIFLPAMSTPAPTR